MSTLKSVHEIVRAAESEYQNGKATISKHVDFSMRETIERIDAYINSRHISGSTDSLGREKPFFNISLAIRNIWYRATDIDRKDIKFMPTTLSSVVLAFAANAILQRWMDKSGFGQFLNNWGLTLATYGSALSKFVEQGGELICSVPSWNRFIPDQIDFDAIPRIERIYKTPEQLRKMPEYDQEAVSQIITEFTTRKNTDGTSKDSKSNFIELFEVHGELDSRHLEKEPDLDLPEAEITYRQQMQVISFFKEKDNEYKDFTVFKGKEARDSYQKDDLIPEDGRTLSIGPIESAFDAQWMSNHTVKNIKDTLDITSKIIFQTADSRYVNRNILNNIQTGDIFIHDENKGLTQVNNSKSDITALQNFGVMWQGLSRDLTNTPDITRGITQAQPLTYGLGQILNNNSNSLFEIMTENKGLAIERMMKRFVIPYIKKKLKNKDEVIAILNSAGINEIDAIYVPIEAVKGYNKRSREAVLNGELPEAFDPAVEEANLKQTLAPLGNIRSLVPDEIGEKTWEEIFSDFEWDSIRVEITNENNDKQAVMQTLTTVLQTVAGNPQMLQDPNAKQVFNAILMETGRLSPLQLTNSSAQAAKNPIATEGQVTPAQGAPQLPTK